MTHNVHNDARQMIALGEALSDTQQASLRAHLQECASCRDYADATGRVLRSLHSQPFAADSALVRATQMRVRARALELQRQQERMWVIAVCCAAVTLATAFTTAVTWRGFAWISHIRMGRMTIGHMTIGHMMQLPSPVWQFGLAALTLLPSIVAAILLLAQGTYLADHNGHYER
jgi:predicted anti-sigma-YlaC factor YlaD